MKQFRTSEKLHRSSGKSGALLRVLSSLAKDLLTFVRDYKTTTANLLLKKVYNQALLSPLAVPLTM
jgi:hypothetical protein